jgi:L-fuconolactonase
MRIVDTHQHFWKYDPQRHGWINDSMAVIQRDFLPTDLKPVLEQNGVEGCISVQVDQTVEETRWMLTLAEENDFIKGVVGWINLRSDRLEEELEEFAQNPLLKGFRHILQAEEPSFMLQPDFVRGIQTLGQLGYTYDILVFPKHLDAVLELLQQCPDQPFIIDHLAKPFIANGEIEDWKQKMTAIAKYPNVHCKISGMVTEADWKSWSPGQLKPYLDVVVESFGTNRLLFGSDWPVCLVASSYNQWLQTVKDYFAAFSTDEQEKIFYQNAERFYRLQ